MSPPSSSDEVLDAVDDAAVKVSLSVRVNSPVRSCAWAEVVTVDKVVCEKAVPVPAGMVELVKLNLWAGAVEDVWGASTVQSWSVLETVEEDV